MRACRPGSDARLQSGRSKSTGSSRGKLAVGEQGEGAIPGRLPARALARPAHLRVIAGLSAPAPGCGGRSGRRGPRHARGFWESAPLTAGGEVVSIVMRRSGRRTAVTRISTPEPI
jgi:hypothetical protein